MNDLDVVEEDQAVTVMADDADVQGEIPPGSLAIVFSGNGKRYLLVPKLATDAPVPDHVMAGTEVFMRIEGESNEELAAAFKRRVTG